MIRIGRSGMTRYSSRGYDTMLAPTASDSPGDDVFLTQLTSLHLPEVFPVKHRRVRLALAVLTLPALGLAILPAPSAAAQTPLDVRIEKPRYTPADVQFMQGMIGHHAQAVVMAKMAPTHGAGQQVALFCRKIINSQADEIELMQNWLRDRGEKVPEPGDPHAGMDMSMPGHMMLMPGMLSPEQLAQLDSARGTDFDRLFLKFMIQHHEGAITMVAKLFDTPGAGQTPEIFGFATGVDADQRAEIARMQSMLATINGSNTKNEQ
jgi:uncharacterized protein (DUF305 family)